MLGTDRQRANAGLALGAIAVVMAAGGDAVAARLIDGALLRPHSVAASKLAPGAVNAPAIAKGAVGTAKLANRSVTSAKIATGAVGLHLIGRRSDPTPLAAGTYNQVVATCHPGETLVAAWGTPVGNGHGVYLGAIEPFGNDFVGSAGAGPKARVWFENTTASSIDVVAWAVCAR